MTLGLQVGTQALGTAVPMVSLHVDLDDRVLGELAFFVQQPERKREEPHMLGRPLVEPYAGHAARLVVLRGQFRIGLDRDHDPCALPTPRSPSTDLPI
jgi:hypothetical protein